MWPELFVTKWRPTAQILKFGGSLNNIPCKLKEPKLYQTKQIFTLYAMIPLPRLQVKNAERR